jgi:hypothetical protein
MSLDSDPKVSGLQQQVFSLLVALVVVSGTVTTFFYYQARSVGRDLQAIRPQATQVIGAFNQNQGLMINFVNSLVAYGQAHPDFRPVLMKYGINPAAAPVAPVAPAK